MLDRPLHGFQRAAGLLHVLPQRADLGGGRGRTFDIGLALQEDQEIAERLLDRLEMIEAGIGGVELLDQMADPVLELADRSLVGAAEAHLLEPVRQAFDDGVEIGRHAGAGLAAALEHLGHGRDALLQGREERGRARDLVDLAGQPLDLLGQLGERAVGRHLAGDAAQPDDGAFQLLHRGRVLGVERDQVDLARQLAHRLVGADQILRRRQGVQCIADLGEPALDIGDGGVGTLRLPALLQPLGQAANLDLQRLDRLPRHRLLEHQADLGQVVAQRLHRGVDPAWPQGLDPGRDLAQLLLEIGQALRRGARQHVGTRRVGRGRPPVGVERALALRDLHQGPLERGRRVSRQRRGGHLVIAVDGIALDRAGALVDRLVGEAT